MSKGDAPRPYDSSKYRAGYEKAFRKPFCAICGARIGEGLKHNKSCPVYALGIHEPPKREEKARCTWVKQAKES